MSKLLIASKNSIKYFISKCMDFVYLQRWKIATQHPCKLLNKQKRKEEIIVSLTSFPGRIHLVHKTIQTILLQSVKPDLVELWLAKEQFPNYEKDLPNELTNLIQYGLKICWCSDYRSFKKLVPSLQEHPDAIIVTADDDVYYAKDWLERLYSAYLEDNNSIHCHKATKFSYEKGKFNAIGGGKKYYHKASFLNKLVGVGGVLYPANSLDGEVVNSELFNRLAPTNDDIWFWFMAIKAGTRINVVKGNHPKPVDAYGSQSTIKLTDINDNGDMLFWSQFNNLISYYPEIRNALISEMKQNYVRG